MDSYQPFQPEVDERFVIRTVLEFDVPIERVWKAISDGDELMRWFPTESAEWELVPGGAGTFAWIGYGSFPMRVEAVDEPTYLAWTWGHEEGSLGLTLVEWHLEAADGGTRLTMVESGILTAEHYANNVEGWEEELGELVALLSGED